MKQMIRKYFAKGLRAHPFPGKYRLYLFLAALLGEEPMPFTIPTRFGLQLTVDSKSWQRLYYLGEDDWRLFDCAIAQVTRGSVVVDVGASIGIFTLPIAAAVGNTGRVVALDASAANFALLEQNCSQNNLTHVTTIYSAVADFTGHIEVPVLPSGNYSLASEGATKTKIPCTRLDQIANQLGISHIDLLKIDVEGSEPMVLRGAKELFLAHRIRTVILEINPHWLNRMGSSTTDLINVIESYGLKANRLDWFGRLQPISLSSVQATQLEYVDVVLVDPLFAT